MEAEATVAERVILVVEKDPDHTRVIQQVLMENSHQIVTIADGNEAMSFLCQKGDYATATRPDLILLDLNLPGKNGKEILAEIKTKPSLRRIPIVVLTTSDSKDDIFNSYALQGNCYVVKSTDVEQLLAIVQRIKEFWLGVVTLPLE